MQTQLTWALAFTGLLATLINAEQLPRWAPAARPAARVPCNPRPPPTKNDCAPAQISSGHLWVSVGIVGIVGMSSQPDPPAGPRGVLFVREGIIRNPPEGVPKPCPPDYGAHAGAVVRIEDQRRIHWLTSRVAAVRLSPPLGEGNQNSPKEALTHVARCGLEHRHRQQTQDF